MKYTCCSCGKELDCSISGECYSDNEFAFSHPHLGGIYCRDCYVETHPFCSKCDTPMEMEWKYCPRCGEANKG